MEGRGGNRRNGPNGGGIRSDGDKRSDSLTLRPQCNYSKHMKTMELKVARIGNSRGVRLPAASLRRYRIGDAVIMEERSDGILLRPAGAHQPKLTWEETAREIAAAAEDWSAWDAAAADGLESAPWTPGRVAERKARYGNKKRGTGGAA